MDCVRTCSRLRMQDLGWGGGGTCPHLRRGGGSTSQEGALIGGWGREQYIVLSQGCNKFIPDMSTFEKGVVGQRRRKDH